MGNIIADFEIKEVEETDIRQVQEELTAIKGTNVDGLLQKNGADKNLDLEVTSRVHIDSNPSSPAEFHSARNSENFSFTDSDISDIEYDSPLSREEKYEEKHKLTAMSSTSSSDVSDNIHNETDVFDEEIFCYLNPDILSDTGSEVSDFDSDFDVDTKGYSGAAKSKQLHVYNDDNNRSCSLSASSDSDLTLENASSQNTSQTEESLSNKSRSHGNSDISTPSEERSVRGDNLTPAGESIHVQNSATPDTNLTYGTPTDNVCIVSAFCNTELGDNDRNASTDSPCNEDIRVLDTDMMHISHEPGDNMVSDQISNQAHENFRRISDEDGGKILDVNGSIQLQHNNEEKKIDSLNGPIKDGNTIISTENKSGEDKIKFSLDTNTDQVRNVEYRNIVPGQIDREKKEGPLMTCSQDCSPSKGDLNLLMDMKSPNECVGLNMGLMDKHEMFCNYINRVKQILDKSCKKIVETRGTTNSVSSLKKLNKHVECNDINESGNIPPESMLTEEGNTGMNSDSGGSNSGPGPGGGIRPSSPRSPGYHKHRNLDTPKTIMDVDYKLLQSGIAVLPGSRDEEGRAVVFIFTGSSLWQNQLVSSVELARLLMYYRSIPRETVRCQGMTVVAVIQGVSTSTINTLLETLYLFEGNCPGGIAVLHFLADSYTHSLVQRSPVYDSQTPFKLDVLLSEEVLQEFIPLDQLPLDLDGLYMYNHEEWIRFHMELDPFVSKIRSVAKYLMCTMQELSDIQSMPASSKESSQLIDHHEQTIKTAFNDQRLISLQTEGESIINCLGREEIHMGHSEDYRDLMENVNKLYDNLNSTMVKLVHIADNRLSKLEQCLQLREFEEECSKIITWTEKTGDEVLLRHTQLADNLKGIRSQQKEFEKFYFSAMTHIEKGNDLLEEASMLAQSGNFDEATGYKELARTLKKHLQSFTSKLEDTRERIEQTAKCYQLLDKTYEWALDAMKYVASMRMEHCETVNGLDKLLRSLELYLHDHPVMKPETFMCMFEIAEKLQSEKLLEQCRIAKERCDETQKLLMLRQSTLKRAREKMDTEQTVDLPNNSELRTKQRSVSVTEVPYSPINSAILRPVPRETSISGHVLRESALSVPVPREAVWEPQSSSTPMGHSQRSHPELRKCVSERFFKSQHPTEDFYTQDMSDRVVTALPKSLTDSRLGSSREDLSESTFDTSNLSPVRDSKSSKGHPISPIMHNSSNSMTSLQTRPIKKVLKRTSTTPLPSSVILEEEDPNLDQYCPQWSRREDLRPVSMITASTDSLSSLPEEESEVPSEEAPPPPPPPRNWTPVPVNSHLTSYNNSMPAFSELKLTNSEKSKRTLSHIMREMIQTERDYVLSLQYIIENYIPELRRNDVPQALRGKGNVIFGNVEKIYQFHCQYFLREVERCERNPFQLAHYFLMHESKFYLYALYNKNKPKSDMLMAEYGKAFFKHKQMQLNDRMDLSSYLLKPVQRMGKYALLLKQIMKECPQSEQEYQDLKAAEQMVKFQLRHGNDLLAMDSLKECDVNLQEQGRLLRQDEFIVWQGRRKSLRHVFLFEDLILFSKTRRGRNGSPDTYLYKYCYKMADVGMTETYGDTGYKFEIWFRKRSKGDSYILQAQSSDTRHHWVKEISRILWNQAIKNREKHLSDMATMGIGNKPCLDIKPSEDQINDRFINVTSGNFQARTRNSIAVSSFDHFRQNNKRPHSIISVSSTSSSNSSHSGAFHPHQLSYDSPRTTTYLSNESGIGTDVSSGEVDPVMRCDQSEQGIQLSKQPPIDQSNLFNDTVSTDV